MKTAILASLLFLGACGSKNNTSGHPIADTSEVIEALYVTDGTTLELDGGPVKRVKNFELKFRLIDSTTVPGKINLRDSIAYDTVYLLPTIDSQRFRIDTAHKPMLDKDGNKIPLKSFAHPIFLYKAFVHETPIHFPTVH